MIYKTRKLVKPPDLNPSNTLFGGQLLKWIDEEAAVFAMCKFRSNHVVTKYMSEIDFINPAYSGDIVEIGCEVIGVGGTSLTLRSEVRIKDTETVIIRIEKIVLVHVDNSGRPKRHGFTMETIGDLTE
jgi:acyl-CoA hydrolase